jgi:hypothetical protein
VCVWVGVWVCIILSVHVCDCGWRGRGGHHMEANSPEGFSVSKFVTGFRDASLRSQVR